jgi:cytochrome c oxidase subunit II
MGRVLALVIWLITLGTIGLFLWHKWWFPPSISEQGDQIDSQFRLTIVVVGVAFFMAQVALGWAVWRYRSAGSQRGTYTHGNTRLELAWTAITGVIFIAIAVMGQRVWAQLHLNEAPPNAVHIEVTGQQFVWNFRYPGADGKFGRNDPSLYNDEDNSPTARPGPIGIDPKDPDGKDDLVMVGLMVVPVNTPVALILRAKDVTHSFFVPQLRLKQDTVPGMKINIHFTAMQEGRYEIACAELCGLGHHRMRAFLEVKSQAGYENWLKEKAQQ